MGALALGAMHGSMGRLAGTHPVLHRAAGVAPRPVAAPRLVVQAVARSSKKGGKSANRGDAGAPAATAAAPAELEVDSVLELELNENGA